MPGEHARARMGIALLLVLATGCETSRTIVREDRRLARFRVLSQPVDLPVSVDSADRGHTPTAVEVPYRLVERRVVPGERKRGWWLLATGLLAVGAGAGLMVWGVNEARGDDPGAGSTVGGILGATWAGLGAAYGLGGLVAGIYYLATTPASFTITETEPASILLGLDLPGEGRREVRIASVDPHRVVPRFEELRSIRYLAEERRWQAEGLDRSLRLTGSGGGSIRPVLRAARPTSPARPVAPPASRPIAAAAERQTESTAVRYAVQSLKQEGEACYRRRDYRCALDRYEKAFALLPSGALRFNIASAQDKLGRTVTALRQYRRYLDGEGNAVPPSIISFIQQRMRLLLPRCARLHLSTRPEEASVTLDGVPVALADPIRAAGRLELILEPGAHRLEVNHAGHRAEALTLDLAAGTLRVLDLVLQVRR